jgi:hypothetical protein
MPHGHIVSIAICHIVPYGAVAIVAVAVGLGLFNSLITLIKNQRRQALRGEVARQEPHSPGPRSKSPTNSHDSRVAEKDYSRKLGFR